jgi:hypothetical protein
MQFGINAKSQRRKDAREENEKWLLDQRPPFGGSAFRSQILFAPLRLGVFALNSYCIVTAIHPVGRENFNAKA